MNRERSGSSSELLGTLTELETELHRLETRRNASRLEALLHPDFAEFGRSGRVFSRKDVLAEFAEASDYPRVVAKSFEVSRDRRGCGASDLRLGARSDIRASAQSDASLVAVAARATRLAAALP